MKEKESPKLHNFRLDNKKIILDGKEINGVISYSINKNSAVAPVELSLKLLVNDDIQN